VFSRDKHGAESAWPGIALAAAVGVDRHAFHAADGCPEFGALASPFDG
jgi:hypothetical protein